MYEYKDFLNGRKKNIEYYKLIDYKIVKKIEYKEDNEIYYKINLKFKDENSNKIIIIDQDEDRYGNFKLLDEKTKMELKKKRDEAFDFFNKLNGILNKNY